MRRLFTILALLSVGYSLGISQTTVEITGSVTDQLGESVAGIDIFISTVFSDSTVHFSTATTDNNGVYSDVFMPPPNESQGVVSVDMIDCDGTFQMATGTWFAAGGPANNVINIDFLYCAGGLMDSCGVLIVQDITANGTISLFAIPLTDAAVTYSWNTGEATQSIIPMQAGTYCVTIADAHGCTASDCFEFNGDSLNCDVMIFHGSTGTNTGLTAVGLGFPPFTYLWSTGELTQSITPSSPGEYCVTLTDATGCEAASCTVLDSSFCEVWISCDPPGSLSAQTFGSPPYTYQWSTGEVTQTITPTEPGEYCVTVEDGFGCVTSTCFYWHPIEMCETILLLTTNPNSVTPIEVTAFSFGFPPFSYHWSTGDTTESILIDSLTSGICVTVTDATGCVDTACTDELLNDCWSWVNVEYTANGQATLTALSDVFGSGNALSYEWSTGETTQSITVTEEGEYCVVVVNANGCVSSACVYVDFDFGTDSCGVFIVALADAGVNGYLMEAHAFGHAPYTYQWSTGELTESIVVSQLSNTICVTITDATGCVAHACYENQGFCNVSIDVHATDSMGILELIAVVPDINVPWEYVWSTGEAGHSILISESGAYCVTVSAASSIDSCVAEACITVIVDDSTGVSGPVQGFIHGDGVDTFTGHVELYSLSPNSSSVFDFWTQVDSTPIVDDNFYHFEDVPQGIYTVRAVLAGDSPGATLFFPTYHYSAVEWTHADIVLVPNPLAVTTDIYLVPQTDANGTGIISGTLEDTDGLLPVPTGSNRSDGIADVQINLTSENEMTWRYTKTNAAGEFSFDGLDWGRYQLRFEVAGIPSPEAWVTIGPNLPEATGVVMTTSDLTSSTDDLLPESALTIMPQPAREELILELEVGYAGEYSVQILTIAGREISRQVENLGSAGSARLDVSSLTSGIYLVQLISDKGQLTRKWVKQ